MMSEIFYKIRRRGRRLEQLYIIFALFVLLLTACAGSPTIPAVIETPIASATPLLATTTPIVVTETPIPPTETPLPEPTAIPLERAQYTLYATLDYAAKIVEVEENILYPNQSGETLNDLLLAVEPNFWASGFILHELTVDDIATNYTLEGQRMVIPLAAPLAPNQNIQIKMRYTLNLPFAEQGDPSVTRARIYGYTNRQANLTNWYPFVVPRQNGAWLLPEPWHFGEHLVYDAVDYEVNFKTTDPSVVVAASANAEPNAEWTRYTLKQGRAFVLSASPEFKMYSQQVGDISVYSYYYPLFEIPAQEVLNVTVRSIQLFSQLYGEYPHKSLSAVQGNFDDGMEYSAFYFQSYGFYNLYDGTPNNHLTAVSAHETAHQWFFESVANDQANEPWVDEMLCTYSERFYYENYAPESLNWWWTVRMYIYNPDTWVDLRVNENSGEPTYWSSAYFHGAHFLEELRIRIGDEAFFAFLKDYRSQKAGQIATGEAFFSILREHTDVDFSDLTIKYFRTPR
ncbi:MAG: M1 family metallopeptidase [Chloroflexi bacterium]|nr:M1 family metallopeptidase [Chloroflexota bacterium]